MTAAPASSNATTAPSGKSGRIGLVASGSTASGFVQGKSVRFEDGDEQDVSASAVDEAVEIASSTEDANNVTSSRG